MLGWPTMWGAEMVAPCPIRLVGTFVTSELRVDEMLMRTEGSLRMLRVESARSVHDPPSSLPEFVRRWFSKIASTGMVWIELTAWTRSEVMRPCFAMLVMSSALLEPVHLHAILV